MVLSDGGGRSVCAWATILGFAAMIAAGPVLAQTSGKTTSKKTGASSKGNDNDADASPLPSLDFAVPIAPDAKPAAGDRDETDAARDTLARAQEKARGIYREKGEIDEKLTPRVDQREVSKRDLARATATSAAAEASLQKNVPQVQRLQRQLAATRDLQAIAQLRDQLMVLQPQVDEASAVLMAAQREVTRLNGELKLLNTEIAALNGRMRVLWKDLQDSRRDWLEVCEPMRKYTHGDYERLQAALDAWREIDPLWPDALVWGALCAFELGDDQKAGTRVEDAFLAHEKLGLPKAWAQGSALRALMSLRIPEQRAKTTGFLQDAQSIAGKSREADWLTWFLVGRVNAEKEIWATKAKAHLERVQKMKPEATCAAVWLARLQSTSTNDAVRDPAAGAKTLEAAWNASNQTSWRLGLATAIALSGADRANDAQALWAKVVAVAPEAMRDEIESQRKLWASGGPGK